MMNVAKNNSLHYLNNGYRGKKSHSLQSTAFLEDMVLSLKKMMSDFGYILFIECLEIITYTLAEEQISFQKMSDVLKTV